MSHYQNIICAIDLGPHSQKLLQTALALVGHQPARVHVIHTCEHPITGYGEATGNGHQITETAIRQRLYPQLRDLVETLAIPVSQTRIAFGDTTTAICELAKSTAADLVVVGGHERNGLKLLFGSTTDSVLHKLPCDVLTVRLDG